MVANLADYADRGPLWNVLPTTDRSRLSAASAVVSAARTRATASSWTNSKPTHLRFSVDIAFIGASGLTEDGITVVDVAEAQIKQAVIERARRVIPMDSSKFGTTDFGTVR